MLYERMTVSKDNGIALNRTYIPAGKSYKHVIKLTKNI
jgi:hypothetical protein